MTSRFASEYDSDMGTPTASAKDQVRALLGILPEDATWDDVLYAAAIRRAIERGHAGLDAGQIVSHDEVLREFGLTR